MKRGDVITVALQGDFGKPRPALVIQSDLFQDHPSITLLPITSEPVDTADSGDPVDTARPRARHRLAARDAA